MRRAPPFAAGLVLIAGVALVARELLVSGQSGRAGATPPAGGRDEPAAAVAFDPVDDATANDARDALAAARRVEPRERRVGTAADDSEQFDFTRFAGRSPKPGSERFFLERSRALAAADPIAFESSAKERLSKSEAPLAEKVAWLLAARDLGGAQCDPLFDLALEQGRAEPRLRAAAVVLLERDAPRSGPACLRLLNKLVLSPTEGSDRSERARAASDAFAFADEATLATAVELVAASTDPLLRTDVLRGLARNSRPAAAAHREHLIGAFGWHAEAAALAAADEPAADSEH